MNGRRPAGAKCDECPLREAEGGQVASEVRPSTDLTIVTDHPREKDGRNRRLLSSDSGLVLLDAMTEAGIDRESVSLIPVVACRPPKDDLKGAEAAVDCCRGRLVAELGRAGRTVLALGQVAAEAVIGRDVDLLALRGGPLSGVVPTGTEADRPLHIIPTIHPSAVIRSNKFKRAFYVDVERVGAWARDGELSWTEPMMAFNPPVGELRAFLGQPGPFAFDVETTMSGVLKCLAVADEDGAVLIRFATVEGDGGRVVPGSAYRDDEWVAVKAALRAFFKDGGRLKVGHNAVLFDAAIIERNLGVIPAPILDTLLLHRAVDPDAPHDLGFVASIYTDAPAWKAFHDRATRSDEELGRYCMLDAVATVRLAGPLGAEAEGLEKAVAHDHAVQGVYRAMRKVGLPVVADEVKGLGRRLADQAAGLEGTIREITRRPGLVVANRAELRKLLFDELGLIPQRYTPGGAPSIDDEGLRLLRLSAGSEHAELLDTLRARGRLGAWQRQLAEAEVGKDGRLRLEWSVQSPVTEWPGWLRGLVRARSGRELVSVRVPDGRLRAVIELAGLAGYVGSPDLAMQSAELMVGPAVRQLVGTKRDNARRIARDLVACALYGDDDESVWKALLRIEGGMGAPRHAGITLREAATLRRRWLGGVPQVVNWWRSIGEAGRKGELVDPVLGRRATRGAGPEVVRWLVDTAVSAKVEQGMLALVEAGLTVVARVGDEVTVEVAAGERGEAERVMREAFGEWARVGAMGG